MHTHGTSSLIHTLPPKLSPITTDDASYFDTPWLSTNMGVADIL